MGRRNAVAAGAGAGAVILAIAMSGCGGGDSGGGGSADTGTSPGAAKAATTTPDAAATTDRKLTIALSAEPRSLDPLLDSDSAADSFDRNVYEALTIRDADGQIQPLLATSYKQDGTSWTFKLRDGVKFQDGSAFTSADVVASFKRILDPKLKSLFKDTYLPGVKRATAVDPSTVKITTAKPDPIIPSEVSMITIASSEYADPSSKKMASAMMGTGPYKLQQWSRGKDIQLERNPDYWGTAGTFSSVDLVFRPDTSVRLAALKTGEVDIAQDIPGDLTSQAPKVAKGIGSAVATMRIASLPGDPLADKRLRQAVNLAVDRKTIVKQLYGGLATSTNGNLMVPQVLGYDSTLTDYPFDPAKAKQLVKDAGAEGTQLTFMIPNGRFVDSQPIGEAIAQELDAVGFKVKTRFVDVSVWGEAAFYPQNDPKATPDLTYFELSNDLFDGYFTLANYACGQPLSATCARSADALLKQASQAGTVEERGKFLQQAGRVFYDGYYFLPVAAPDIVAGIAKDLDWKPRPQAFIYFSDIKPAAA